MSLWEFGRGRGRGEETDWVYYSDHLMVDAGAGCAVVEEEGCYAVDDHVECWLSARISMRQTRDTWIGDLQVLKC